jgi:beta-N-acetylhexosaminidase
MVAQMLMVGFSGQDANTADGTVAAISSGRLGNTVLFDRNIVSPPQLKALDDALQGLAPGPMLISTDEEGGYVARLRPENGFPPTVSAEYLGNQNDLNLTYRYAASMAGALRDSGINLNLAPDVDVNVNPSNPVIGQYERSFSADPEVVAQQALTFIRAHHDAGILCTLKHFAGHGSSTADSHLGIVDVTNTWTEKELIPFQRVIDAGQADAIMTAHIFNGNIDSEYPGTLSKPTITGLLREKMGYDGVVITDDMQMGAIRQYFGFERAVELAIVAGADIIAIANTLAYDPGEADAAFNAVMAALSKGSVSEARIEQSYTRIQRLKSRIA